jgi:hypothetical protein
MHNKIWLALGVLLLVIGLFKPNFELFRSVSKPNNSVECYVTDAPADTELLKEAQDITKILLNSSDSTRKSDSLKLSSLYCDMSTLISLDGEDQVIKDTAAIRSANSLAGKMLKLNIKDKYPDLATESKDLVIKAIGDDDVVLSTDLRHKAVDAFRALSWAFYEGSK